MLNDKANLAIARSKRRFGIEFEHISKYTMAQLREVLVKNKIPCDRPDTRDYIGWQIKGDGSITPQTKYPYGIELVAPPIMQKDFSQVRQVLELAKSHGGVNSSCGLHVHVHAPELAAVLVGRPNSEWQQYITQAWTSIEKTMFSYMPPSRRNGQYCRPGVQWATKYMALNFSPLHDDRKTVEFRLHNATLNPVKAFAFAMLCRGIVEAMVQRTAIPVIDPGLRYNTEPRLIHTPRGGEFVLQRDKQGKWLIEAKKLTVEVNALPEAFKEFKKELRLSGKSYLAAFRYPRYGNAMSELCKIADVRGVFRGYLEDRYDRMVTLHGTATAQPVSQRVVPDEADFYNEPDLVQQMVEPEEEEPEDSDNSDDYDRAAEEEEQSRHRPRY